MPKARSFVRSGRTPMNSAAMSRSRLAIHDRPTRPRTRVLARRAKTTTSARAVTYRVGPDGQEPAGAQRELSGVPGEEVQPDRRERVDQERDQHRLEPVLVGRERRHDERGDRGETDEPAVLRDREDRLVAGVAGLEL